MSTHVTEPLLEEIRRSYNLLAAPYAEHLADELKGKPLDRQFLDRFAEEVRGAGPVCDLGCGPGQVARYLHDRGVDVSGIDLSPGMLEQARLLHQGVVFREGNLFHLDVPDGAFAGIAAFYSIVHIPPAHLPEALREWRRALRQRGTLLLAFHIGEDELRPGSLWDVPTPLTWYFFRTEEVVGHLRSAGFRMTDVIERWPYENAEHPSRRAYLFAERT